MGLFIKRNEDLMITTLRFAGGSSVLWFGISKLVHPELWYEWVPDFLWQFSLLTPDLTMFLLGLAEIVIGLLLILGRFVRTASLVGSMLFAAVFVLYGGTDAAVQTNVSMGIFLALFINANRESDNPIPRKWLAMAVTVYLFVLFISGLLYLKQ